MINANRFLELSISLSDSKNSEAEGEGRRKKKELASAEASKQREREREELLSSSNTKSRIGFSICILTVDGSHLWSRYCHHTQLFLGLMSIICYINAW
jgi:hypothetical protein